MQFQPMLLCILALFMASANATTLFYNNDLSGFEAVTATTLTSFEGIAASDNALVESLTFTLNDNVYSNSTGTGKLLVCGKVACNGQPFDSAVLAANGNTATIRIELGTPAAAIGGLFGDLNGPAGTGTLRIFDSGGLFDTRAVAYGDMGAGLSKTFFGWTSDETEFTALEFSIFDSADFSAMDDFRFGEITPAFSAPLPAGVWLFGTALAGLAGLSRRRRT
jgi:hypothetical protein